MPTYMFMLWDNSGSKDMYSRSKLLQNFEYKIELKVRFTHYLRDCFICVTLYSGNRIFNLLDSIKNSLKETGKRILLFEYLYRNISSEYTIIN